MQSVQHSLEANRWPKRNQIAAVLRDGVSLSKLSPLGVQQQKLRRGSSQSAQQETHSLKTKLHLHASGPERHFDIVEWTCSV